MLPRANRQYQCQGLEPQRHVLEKTLPKGEQVLVEGILSVGHSAPAVRCQQHMELLLDEKNIT